MYRTPCRSCFIIYFYRPADDGGSHYELVRPVQGAPSSHTPGPASSATRELDDLMASLSEIKVSSSQ